MQGISPIAAATNRLAGRACSSYFSVTLSTPLAQRRTDEHRYHSHLRWAAPTHLRTNREIAPALRKLERGHDRVASVIEILAEDIDRLASYEMFGPFPRPFSRCRLHSLPLLVLMCLA